jgi:hypothetical protein
MALRTDPWPSITWTPPNMSLNHNSPVGVQAGASASRYPDATRRIAVIRSEEAPARRGGS